MENAADALKISFAVLVFIVALALTFSIIGKTRATADVVLYHTDKTNFQELKSPGENRIVSPAEIVTTLYRIPGESIVVRIKIPGEQDEVISGKSESEIDEILQNGVLTEINNFCSDDTRKFIEEFAEVDYSGIYRSAEDGTKVTIADGGTAMYITYIPVRMNADGTYDRLD